MEILQPTYLWALAGLFVPIAIHLWSRKNHTVVPWGMVKFIPEEASRKAASIHWEDTLRFILRSLAWIILVLILANPTFYSSDNEEKVSRILIAPSLLSDARINKLIDTTDQTVHVLDENLSLIDEYKADSINDDLNYWSLLKAISETTSSVRVYSYADVKNFGGKKPTTSFPVEWILWPREEYNLKMTSVSLGSNQLTPLSDGRIIYYDRMDLQEEQEPITYHISPNVENASILESIMEANVLIKSKKSDTPGAINFIKSGEVSASGLNFVLSDSSDFFKVYYISENSYAIPEQALLLPEAIKSNIVLQIFDILQSEGVIPSGYDRKEDLRQLDYKQIVPEVKYQESNVTKSSISLQPYLWVMLFILIIAERLVTIYRK